MVRCRVGVRNVGIRALKLYHTKAMAQFLQKKIDVFVNLLTGCAVAYLATFAVCFRLNF